MRAPLASFRSFRTKLQLAFVTLGLATIAVADWQASGGAAAALRQASYDRLTAVRETRASELERYFHHIRNQVAALASDATTLSALEELQSAWPAIPAPPQETSALRDYYRQQQVPDLWFPSDPRMLALQQAYLAGNPHPRGAKDLLLDGPALGRYGDAHARFHSTFHRYKTAFGYYDIFLIESHSSRVLYTVMKEIDLGANLDTEPYRASPLAAAYRKALGNTEDGVVMTDYEPYIASGLAPAAFVATPLRRAGAVIGVLAIQISIDEVNAVMSGEGRWREQGFGETGHVYAVGPDNTLRSDLRKGMEDPETYLKELSAAGIASPVLDRIRQNGTGVLAYAVNLSVVERIRGGESGTELGRNTFGTEVLRSHGPLRVGDLHWAIISEVDNREALAPVRALQRRILTTGGAIALLLFFVAGWLGTSVTGPVLKVASFARRLGKGERGLRIPVLGSDEIAQLASDFNSMSDDLERTTVSKRDLEILAGRLITAQEDERRRIARELHDDFTQRLAAAAIAAGRLAKSPATAESMRDGLNHLKQELATVSDEVHGLSRRLHPAVLDDLGLIAAIEVECRAAFERGLLVDLKAEGPVDDVPHEVRLALYRIVQEGLRNIQKHSGATEAELRLARDADSVAIVIRDRGAGFDRTQSGWHRGLGLASMEERARLLGGQFRVASSPGVGTTVQVILPASPKES